MGIWGPIQTAPIGLLGLLNLKNVGRNPTDLSDTLVPQVDLLDWYLNAARIRLPATYSLSLNTGASGWNAFTSPGPLVVPQNEWWYVHQAVANAAPAAAGDRIRYAGMALDPGQGAGNGNPFLMTDVVDWNGIGAGNSTTINQDPFWLSPGALIGIQAEFVNVAAPRTVQMFMTYTPLRI